MLGRAYFYTRDHLGSIRELTTSTGTIAARYDYDPYGVTTLVQGTNLADFQYAGMYVHQPSGFYLSATRPYNPNLGRWLQRDPIQEQGGLNMYAYCGNDPLNKADLDGRNPIVIGAVGVGVIMIWHAAILAETSRYLEPGTQKLVQTPLTLAMSIIPSPLLALHDEPGIWYVLVSKDLDGNCTAQYVFIPITPPSNTVI